MRVNLKRWILPSDLADNDQQLLLTPCTIYTQWHLCPQWLLCWHNWFLTIGMFRLPKPICENRICDLISIQRVQASRTWKVWFVQYEKTALKSAIICQRKWRLQFHLLYWMLHINSNLGAPQFPRPTCSHFSAHHELISHFALYNCT